MVTLAHTRLFHEFFFDRPKLPYEIECVLSLPWSLFHYFPRSSAWHKKIAPNELGSKMVHSEPKFPWSMGHTYSNSPIFENVMVIWKCIQKLQPLLSHFCHTERNSHIYVQNMENAIRFGMYKWVDLSDVCIIIKSGKISVFSTCFTWAIMAYVVVVFAHFSCALQN